MTSSGGSRSGDVSMTSSGGSRLDDVNMTPLGDVAAYERSTGMMRWQTDGAGGRQGR